MTIRLTICRTPTYILEKLPFISTRWERYECVACFKKVAQDLTTRASFGGPRVFLPSRFISS